MTLSILEKAQDIASILSGILWEHEEKNLPSGWIRESIILVDDTAAPYRMFRIDLQIDNLEPEDFEDYFSDFDSEGISVLEDFTASTLKATPEADRRYLTTPDVEALIALREKSFKAILTLKTELEERANTLAVAPLS